MKSLKVQELNRKAGDPKNKPDEVLEAIALKPGQVVLDLGAGGGYFSFRFAEIVGEKGKVYALDINQEFLKFIEENAKEKKLHNIIPVLVRDKLDLPKKSLDLIFMRNVTHHLPNRIEYFKNLKQFLRADGRVVIIEYKRGKFFSFRSLFKHYLPKKKIIKEMGEAGYLLEKDFDFLPEQHFTIWKINQI
ncbi:MAG: class I SAM-dependent methyltransferase [candidate division WOR-3 bacterium]